MSRCTGLYLMGGMNAMRRDLDRRISDLEKVVGQGADTGERVEVPPEVLASIRSNPDDAAALDRIEAGDEGGYADMSDKALRLLSDAGGKACTMAGCGCR